MRYLFSLFVFFVTFFLPFVITSQTITIDGDMSDWNGISVLINDGSGDGSDGWDFVNVYVTDDADNVYFRVENASSSAGSKSLYLFVSVDPQNEPDTRTGLSYGWWDNGYDFMVQFYAANLTLYRHKANSDGWDWENGGTNEQKWKQTGGADDYTDVEIAIAKSDLDNPNISGWTHGTQNKIAVMVLVDGYGEEAGSGSNHGGVIYNLQNGVLPVELRSFTANVKGNSIILNWNTATEVNNYGFEIQRSAVSVQPQPVGINSSEWKTIGFVEGNGTSNSPKEYSFVDVVSQSGKYSYRLKQIDIVGSYEYSNIVEVIIGVPEKFELGQNYPNPFNPTTTIKYSIPSVETLHATSPNVQMIVYDVLGREITTLINQKQLPGNYSVKFDASGLQSGIYFYTLRAGDFAATKKMILMK